MTSAIRRFFCFICLTVLAPTTAIIFANDIQQTIGKIETVMPTLVFNWLTLLATAAAIPIFSIVLIGKGSRQRPQATDPDWNGHRSAIICGFGMTLISFGLVIFTSLPVSLVGLIGAIIGTGVYIVSDPV